jgi:hypothetical protein
MEVEMPAGHAGQEHYLSRILLIKNITYQEHYLPRTFPTSTMPSLTLGLLLPPLLLILHLVHRYLSPLRVLNAIPNAHPTAPFSSLWLLSIRYRKRENRTVWEAHKRLGPVVRLAPDEVSVCTLQSLKTIYGGWEKNSWYEAFINYE